MKIHFWKLENLRYTLKLSENLKVRDHWESLSVDVYITLEWILGK
jgi:hypothetical protein